MLKDINGCLLRLGTILDFDNLYKIYMNEDNNRFLSFEIMSKEEFKKIFNEIILIGNLYIFEKDSQIISTCIISRKKRRTSHISVIGNLATNPEFKGKGYSFYFIETLISLLKEEGIKRLELYVESDNNIALNFYKKLGFMIEGKLKNYFKRENEDIYVDEFIMAKLI